jgi:hypothetical protein
MCVQALPLLLSAGGTALQQASANQERRDRERIASENLRRNNQINQEAGQRVSQEIQKVASANPEAERMKANNDFMDALRKAKVSDGGSDFGAPPGASDRFTADVGQAREGAGAEGRALAGNLAAIDAPQYARVSENRGLADTATDLSLIEGRGKGQDFLAQLAMARANGNPGLATLGSGLSSFGNAYAQRAVPIKPKPVSSGLVGPR